MSNLIKVGVLRGGAPDEYDVSLKTGSQVLKHLPENKYHPFDMLIDREGIWYLSGFPITLDTLRYKIDVVFNALHGYYGEDGKVQQFLENLHIPYTGSGPLASALAMNKKLAKNKFNELGIKTPLVYIISEGLNYNQIANDIFNKISPPWIIKPISGGSSIGIRIVKTISDLILILKEIDNDKHNFIVEQFIQGREATCGVIQDFRGDNLYSLLPVQILRPKNNFFSTEMKYNKKTKEICLGNFSREENQKLQDLAKKIHNGFNLKHYSRSDFIITNSGQIYALEVNSLPGFTEDSLFPLALDSIGCLKSTFLDHIVTLALNKK